MAITSEYKQVANIQSVIDIDNIGYRFGLIRVPNESLLDFKRRILSIFTHPTNTTEEGISASLARALNSKPAFAGYIEANKNQIAQNPKISFDGYELIMSSDKIYTFQYNTPITTIFGSQDQSSDPYPFILNINPEYSNKNLVSFLPFKNYKDNVREMVRPGINYINNYNVLKNSFSSQSGFLRSNQAKNSPSELMAVGDYYHDGNDKLYIYDSGTNVEIEVFYSTLSSYIPLYYCPVTVISAYKFTRDVGNNIDKSGFAGQPSNLDIEYLWDIFIESKIWKSYENSPTSVRGTYYAE